MIVNYSELNAAQKQQFITVFGESFFDMVDKKAKYTAKLKVVFGSAFLPQFAYAFLDGDNVAGLITCSNAKSSAMHFSKAVCQSQFGSILGAINYRFFKALFGKPFAKADDEGYIDFLCVDKDHRRRGIASQLPLKYFDGRTYGELLSRVTNDIDTVSSTLQQSVTQVVSAFTLLIGITVMMFTISWLITLVVIIVLPISFILIRMIVKRSQKYFKQQQKEIGNINGHVEEMYAGHMVVKAFGKEEGSVAKFDKRNERLYGVGWKAQFLSGLMMPIMTLVNNLSYVLVCVIGGVMVINGRMTIGNVQAFIQYSRSFSQPIAQTAQIANVMQSTVAAAERVFEILDETEMSAESTENLIDNPKGAVTFEHVRFGYDPGITIIKDMNLDVAPGDVGAIVGPTGAGKTTLVNLLMRFYEVDSGRITVDGVDITTVPRENLRKAFGMVLQDTWLFGGTIEDNIRYGNDNASMDDVVRAAKKAHADHFIRTLPDGYGTVLNEEASNISQGQKQLLTIARALLADPPVLILDEATSSVDTRTEEYIQSAMIELMKGRTNFVIAHRLSTIRDASTILVMNEGEVIEQGNHKTLMDMNGFYADLYNSQFTGNTDV